MRTFRNPQGDGGHDVLVDQQIDGNVVRAVIRPGETADVEFPDWQPCPDLLEEVSTSRVSVAVVPESIAPAAADTGPSEEA